MDSRFVYEVMSGERGLGSIEDRAEAAAQAKLPPEAMVASGIRDELTALAQYLEECAERIEKMYADISLNGETETRCLHHIVKAIRARATGELP